ncbi:MAG: YadA-like family protein [Veillonellaceae bacterium]|nr:YadA-like family protein [Veillonellaceae bacterium]
MNKIYKTIWSKTRGMYIVVSELAHSHRGSVSGAARSTLLTACVLAAVGGLALQAEAANSVDYVSVKSNKSVSSAAGDDSVAIGPEAKAIAANTVALGHKVEANANKAVAVGTNNTVAQERGIAVGTDLSTVGKRTILMGSKIGTDPKKVEQTNIGIGVAILDWNVVSRPIILGRMAALAGANNPGANNIAVGNDFHLVNLPVEVDSTGTVKIKATKGNERGVAQDAIVFGNGAEDGKTYVVGNQSIVLGRISNSFLSDSISIGNDTKNVLGITIGNNAETQKAYSMALGTNAVAKEMQTVALGDESVADRKSGVLGYDPSTGQAFAGADKTAWQSGLGAVSVGKADATRQITNVSAGSEDTDAVNVAQLKSLDTKVTTEITNLKNRKTPFVSIKGKSGDGNFAGDGATGDVAIAIGPNATAKGNYAVAMGGWTAASGGNSLALGVLSKASGSQSTAIGAQAAAKASDTIAIGTSTIAGVSNAIALGAAAKSNQLGGLAAGSKAEVASTGYNGIALGSNSYVGPKTAASPGDHSVPGNGLVIGPDVNDKEPTTAGMTEQNAMAIGQNAKAFGYQNTSLGAGAETHDTNTLAVGIAAIAKGDYAVALGKQAKTFAEKAIAAGWHASADEASAAAFGARAHATKANGLALGANSLVQDEASVALGSGTIASGAKDGQAYLSNEEVAKAAGIVSVGNPTYTITQDGTATEVAASYRRITNMAGGIDDHDAVNVAQLKALNAMVDGKGTMSSWKLKAKGDTAAETIEDGNEVVFDVKDGEKALTVARDGNTIKYGIDVSKLDFNNTTAITNIANSINNGNTAITNISAKFKVSNGTNTQEVELKKNTSPVLNFTGADKEIDVQVAAGGDGPKVTIGLAQGIKDKLDALDASGNRSVKYDLQADGKTVDTTKITLAGAGGTTITNVKDGAVSKNSKDAVNGSQLNATNERVTKVEGDITNINKQITDLQTQTNENKVTVEGDDKTGVKVESEDIAGGGKNYKVKLDDTIKVGGDDGVVINGTDNVIQGLSNTTLDTGYGEGDRAGQAATEGQLKQAFDQAVAGATTTVKEGANITVTKTDGKSEYTVALNKDLTGIDSISVGADAEGKGAVVINKDGINAGDKKITDVANGEISKTSKDAVNGSQLFATNEQVAQNTTNITKLGDQVINLGHDLNDLRDESRDGLAMGAALAALKPLQYDPYDRNQIMAGVGHYKGKSAVALGISHFSNERTMWHAGIALGAKSDTMVNAGVTWRFGGDDERSKLPERYQDGPISSVYVLQDEVTALQTEVAELKEQIRALLAAKA